MYTPHEAMIRTAPPSSSAGAPEPAWEIAELFPPQGLWSEEEYLALKTNRLVEFDDGSIEVLPLPTKTHQSIILFICQLLGAHLAGQGRIVLAGYPLRIPGAKYREPDVIYLTPEQDAAAGEKYCEAAQLVMEVVSVDDPDRDYVTKRSEYAAAGIPEYWIVDAHAQTITVLRLTNGDYAEHGRFGPGQQAVSATLPGFAVSVDEVLRQGQ